jgi:Flp pilus assembly protein TadG
MITSILTRWLSPVSDTRGSQIVEFAVALPLLVVFVVGIFDFGNAFNIKYKLTNAVREGARFAAAQPTSDLSQPTVGTTGSLESVASQVANNLLTANVNDCGLSGVANQTVTQPAPLTWTYTTSTGCSGATLTLTIERGYTFTAPASSIYPLGLTVEATRVTLSYPYKWQFNRVIQFLVPGGTFPGTSQISVVSVMQNLH